MINTSTVSLNKEFVSTLRELNNREQDEIKIISAMFINSCKNIKEKKINLFYESIFGQISFYGKSIDSFSGEINKIVTAYDSLIENVLNLYVTRFIALINELQNLYGNQKISITNCKISVDSKNEVKKAASEYRVDNYEVLIQECKKQLLQCKKSMEEDINVLFYDKGNALALKKPSIFQKIKNLFTGSKKVSELVMNPLYVELNNLKSNVDIRSEKISKKTLDDISIIEDGVIQTKSIFSSMLKEYGINGW